MRPSSLAVLLICICCGWAACRKTGNPPPPIHQNPAPTLSGISPDSGIKNTPVTINGTGFGTDTTKVKVSFNGIAAVVQSLTDTRIVALVPAKAGTGAITVDVSGQSVQGPVFNYVFSYTVSTLAGSGQPGYANGTGAAATFTAPRGVTVDSAGNVYVADFGDWEIRKISPAGVVTTLAGNAQSLQDMLDGPIGTATFSEPLSIGFDAVDSSLYLMDLSYVGGYNNRLRKITLGAGANVTTISAAKFGYADGSLGSALFSEPFYLTVDAQANVYLYDGNNYRIREVSAAGIVSTLAGNGTPGTADGPAGGATVDKVWGLAVDRQGNVYYTDVINNSIRKISGGNVTTLAGGTPGQGVWADGSGSAAVFANPTGIVADNDGNLYVSDIHNLCIRKVTPAGVVTTIAGDPRQPGFVDGVGTAAKFQSPYGITIDNKGNLYVADMDNNAIRKITRE